MAPRCELMAARSLVSSVKWMNGLDQVVRDFYRSRHFFRGGTPAIVGSFVSNIGEALRHPLLRYRQLTAE